jgi:hypothetical protein
MSLREPESALLALAVDAEDYENRRSVRHLADPFWIRRHAIAQSKN